MPEQLTDREQPHNPSNAEALEGKRVVIEAVRDIEAVESEIVRVLELPSGSPELSQETDDVLVEIAIDGVTNARHSHSEALRAIETALIETALEATGERPAAERDPAEILESRGFDDVVNEAIADLHEQGAETPNGQEIAEVVAREIDSDNAEKDSANARDSDEATPSETGVDFLLSLDGKLHMNEYIAPSLHRAESRGENISQKPKEKVGAYLADITETIDRLKALPEEKRTGFVKQFVEQYAIDPGSIPDKYYENQKRIARERGLGDVEIDRVGTAETIRSDQIASLANWANYLVQDEAQYPSWFKRYTFDGVTKLGKYDKEKGKFQKRTESTLAPYPELNAEALANVYDALNKTRVSDSQKLPDKELDKLVRGGNFAKMYEYSLGKLASTGNDQSEKKEVSRSNEGSWRKFDQSDDPLIAAELSKTLQGKNTGWCTAGESTAQQQLQTGDFYVFYSKDDEDNETAPRVAIRMDDGKIAEIRGVASGQNLEISMIDTALEKAKSLPGGQEYFEKAEDMKRVTILEQKIANNEELSVDELEFIYQQKRKIKGFGQREDPRIQDMLKKRNAFTDYEKMYGEQGSKLLDHLMRDNKLALVFQNIDRFDGLDLSQISGALVDRGYAPLIAKNMDKFPDLSHGELVERAIASKEPYQVENLLPNVRSLSPKLADAIDAMWVNGIETIALNRENFSSLSPQIMEKLKLRDAAAWKESTEMEERWRKHSEEMGIGEIDAF